MIWGPIADEFGIDLVLLGHSHYYTVTNVIHNNKTVSPLESTMTDAEGTVYMVSGSITRPRDDDEIGLNGDWIGFVDADDYLDSAAISTLVEVLRASKTNIAQMKSYIVNEDYTIRLNQSTGTKAISVASEPPAATTVSPISPRCW